MDDAAILKKIVQEDGNCAWARESVCMRCPLARLKQKEDGSFYSCLEALKAHDLSEEAADVLYKEVAERLLLDEAVEAILEERNAVE